MQRLIELKQVRSQKSRQISTFLDRKELLLFCGDYLRHFSVFSHLINSSQILEINSSNSRLIRERDLRFKWTYSSWC